MPINKKRATRKTPLKIRKSVQKNVSMPKAGSKTIKEVKQKLTGKPAGGRGKKPFGGHCGRKKKLTPEQERAQESIRQLEDKYLDEADAQQCEAGSDLANSFFYTDEKFITQFDDDEISSYICRKYSGFNPSTHNDSLLKKTIIEILNDEEFMLKILERYCITIFDFFKYMYRVEPLIFKGLFISRIQNAIKNKPYANFKRSGRALGKLPSRQ